ncbi:MAG: M56 family metallopeptidase [Acidobacteria bacterium]|nr:M56 family metallopeptidase [Acidobacteriota bacterium]
MNGAESMVMSYVVNSLWQVPLIAFAAWLAAKVVRPLGPGAEHRVWVSALLAEATVPGLSLLPWQKLNVPWPFHVHAEQAAQSSVVVQLSGGTASEGLRFPAAVIVLVVGIYGAATLYLIARFIWRWVRLKELERTAKPASLTIEADASWQRGVRRFAAKDVALVSSRQIFAPLTMGVSRKLVMLPEKMIASFPHAELETVIGHELAHVKRMDFAKNLAYELLSLSVGYHPGVWFVRQRLTESREMVCDAMAAEISGSREYAQSLLKLAGLLLQGKAVRVPYAIGVFDSSTLERRLMKLTEMKKEIGRFRRSIALSACVVLGVAAATSAVALRIGVNQKSSDSAKKDAHSVSVDAKTMQKQLLAKVPPVYPPKAKAAKIQGKVVLDAVVGRDGQVENLKVVSGPKELQQSALDAVRQWVYKPFLLNSEPVNVTTTITVIYTLGDIRLFPQPVKP